MDDNKLDNIQNLIDKWMDESKKYSKAAHKTNAEGLTATTAMYTAFSLTYMECASSLHKILNK